MKNENEGFDNDSMKNIQIINDFNIIKNRFNILKEETFLDFCKKNLSLTYIDLKNFPPEYFYIIYSSTNSNNLHNSYDCKIIKKSPLIGISKIGFDQSKTQALLAIGYKKTLFAPSDGYLYFMEKQDNRWIISKKYLFISGFN